MPKLKISLLGTPQIHLNDGPLSFKSRKVIALLAYIVVTERRYSRDEVTAFFLPESEHERARSSLRTVLANLKKKLAGQWLEIDRHHIAFTPDDQVSVDVVQFRQLLNGCAVHRQVLESQCADCIASLAAATDHYRGDFLSGFSLRDCPDFDDWQLLERENLRRTLAEALQTLIDIHAAQGAIEPAIAYARRWVKLDTLHEPAHRTLG